jgi:hypothetical protein
MLSEIKQTLKQKYHIISIICGILKIQPTTQYQQQNYKKRKWLLRNKKWVSGRGKGDKYVLQDSEYDQSSLYACMKMS